MDKLLARFINNWINEKVKKSTWLNFFLVFFGPLVAVILVFTFNAIGINDNKATVWVLFAIFVPMILLSLFLGQQLDLIGSFGESILLLIPTFVWLLPGSDDAISILITVALIFVFASLGLFLISLSMKMFVNPSNNERIMKMMLIMNRMAFTAISVVSTLIISIIMIHWARSLEWHIDASGTEDYTTAAWIAFISVVTLGVGLTLVLLGLLNGAVESFKNDNELAGADPKATNDHSAPDTSDKEAELETLRRLVEESNAQQK